MKGTFRRDRSGRWFGEFEYEKGVDDPLKPCPFCGNAEDFQVFGVSTNAHYFVRCATCCTDGGSHDLPAVRVTAQTFRSRAAIEAAHREGFERGIAAWNRRAAPAGAAS